MQKIVTFLWFDTQAEEAANFYVSVFKNSKLGKIARRTEAVPGPTGSVLTIEFQLEGQWFVAMNGGPEYAGFTPAISLNVNCNSQEEIDTLWEKLQAGGGEEVQCGWLKDKYGLSWQVVPDFMPALIQSEDKAKVNRVMIAMMKMKKLDIAALKKAAEG